MELKRGYARSSVLGAILWHKNEAAWAATTLEHVPHRDLAGVVVTTPPNKPTPVIAL
jgi:hypothetical protein